MRIKSEGGMAKNMTYTESSSKQKDCLPRFDWYLYENSYMLFSSFAKI